MKHRITLTTKPGILNIGDKVTLTKDPANEYDNESIRVMFNGVPQGYVSAFYKTRKPGTISAGRLYDKIPASIEAVVVDEGIAEVETEG
jgi:hypothetical protein